MALVSVVYMWSVFNSEQDVMPAAAAISKAPDLRRVDAYRAFVDSPGVTPDRSHEYTARGIEHLAEAIRSVADTDAAADDSIARQLATFQQKADALRANPTAEDHADIVKDVFRSAAGMIARLQRARRIDVRELETRIAALEELARGVDSGEPLLQQQARVRKFFESSADALYMLGRGTAAPTARS